MNCSSIPDNWHGVMVSTHSVCMLRLHNAYSEYHRPRTDCPCLEIIWIKLLPDSIWLFLHWDWDAFAFLDCQVGGHGFKGYFFWSWWEISVEWSFFFVFLLWMAVEWSFSHCWFVFRTHMPIFGLVRGIPEKSRPQPPINPYFKRLTRTDPLLGD